MKKSFQINRNVQRYEVVDGTIAPFFLHHLNPTATTRRKSFLNAWARHAVCDGAQAWSTVSAWHGHRWLAMRLTRPVAVLSCPVVHDIAYIDAVYTSGRCPIMSGRARPDSVTQASRTGLSANWTRTSEQSSTVHSVFFSKTLFDFKKSISGLIELKFSGKTPNEVLYAPIYFWGVYF